LNTEPGFVFLYFTFLKKSQHRGKTMSMDNTMGGSCTSTDQSGKTGGDAATMGEASGGMAGAGAAAAAGAGAGAGGFANDAGAGAMAGAGADAAASGGMVGASGGDASDNTSIGSININS
jgi:hypothetical protein